MDWQTIKIPNQSRGKCTPYASIGHNQLILSAAACELIENYEEYEFVELLIPKNRDKIKMVGVKLCKISSNDSIKIRRIRYKDKYSKGIIISNKKILANIFGVDRASGDVTRFPVKKDDEDDSILVITLNT